MEVIGALAGTRHARLACCRAARAISWRARCERRAASSARCRRCSHGDLASVDLGYIPECNRRFAFSSGVGVDARMIDETHPETKRRFGIGAYMHTGVQGGAQPAAVSRARGGGWRRRSSARRRRSWWRTSAPCSTGSSCSVRASSRTTGGSISASSRRGTRPMSCASRGGCSAATFGSDDGAALPERPRVPHRVRSAAAVSGGWRAAGHDAVLRARAAARCAAAGGPRRD